VKSKVFLSKPKVIIMSLMAVFLFVLLISISSGHKRDDQAYFQPLTDFLSSRGYTYKLEPLADQAGSKDVPIYNETVWYSLCIGTDEEELLVYFDSSNRAKHLADQFCRGDETRKVVYVGLRFILCYSGTDEGIIRLMDEWQEQMLV